VTFEHAGARISLEVRVRHVRQTADPHGTVVYLPGVEFISVPPPFPNSSRPWPEKSGIGKRHNLRSSDFFLILIKA
jgi:hypothetical protein